MTAVRDILAPATARLGLALACGLALSGCATLERGETDDIPVHTSPSGATVSSSTGMTCTSPCIVTALRMENVVITVAKPGYAPRTVVAESRRIAGTEGKLSPRPSLDYFGRIADAKTHADFEHVPNAVSVVLVAQAAPK